MTRPRKSEGTWPLAEELAIRLDVEYGEDLATLVRMSEKELENRLDVLDGHGFSTVNRRKVAGKGLKTVES